MLALQYFTRIPVTGPLAEWAGYGPISARASAAHLPGVGILIGMAACIAFAVTSLLLPDVAMTPLAAAIACTVATVLLTGALHEDGLADLADGLGGSAERERALEIMKDSRIGSFGTIALVLAFGLKVALLAVIAAQSPAGVLAALIAAHAVSRFWPLVVAASMPYVGDAATSKSKPLVESLEQRAVHIGAAWCLLPLVLMVAAGRFGFMLVAVAASAAAFWWMRRLLQRRLQGYTGDALGAVQQVAEIAFYLGAGVGIGIGGGR
nr:adenosylcobinamide-GDP ribazoletransferase [Ramlibacter albus]